MNYKCKSKSLPKLIEPMIDNLLSTLWKELKMPALLSRAGIDQALWTLRDHDGYLHMLWRWTNSPGTRMFCHQSPQHMLKMHHGTVHDLLNNPKMNWRGWQWALAKTGLVQHDQGIRALVVDDSIKERRSKKMNVVAFHDDHARGYTVKGHQVVALGLSTEHGHYPLDQEMSISYKGQQSKGGGGGVEPDRRTQSMRRYRDATTCSKIELVGKRVKRFVQSGIEASCLLADSWYRNKAMMRIAIDTSLTGLYRMKNGPLQFREVQDDGSNPILAANEIYRQQVRCNWSKSSIVHGSKWRIRKVIVWS